MAILRGPWKRKRWVLSATGATAVAAIAVSLVGFLAPAPVERQAFEKLIPADAGSALVTPAGESWWTLIAAVAPTAGLSALDPDKAPAPITAYGASVSAAPGAAGARGVYLQTADAKSAEAVSAWLQDGDASVGRTSTTAGDVVFVSTSTPEGFYAAGEFTKRSPSTDTNYWRDTKAGKGGVSAQWIDFDLMTAALTAPADANRKAAFSAMFAHATGFEKGTRWAGRASATDAAWTGEFAHGGFHSEDADSAAAMSVLDATRRDVTIPATSETEEATAIDSGMASMLSASYFGYGMKDAGGAPLGSEPSSWPQGVAKGGDLHAVIDVTEWIAGASGLAARGEGIEKFALSVTGSKMSVALIQNKSKWVYAKPSASAESDQAKADAEAMLEPVTPAAADWQPGDATGIEAIPAGDAGPATAPGEAPYEAAPAPEVAPAPVVSEPIPAPLEREPVPAPAGPRDMEQFTG